MVTLPDGPWVAAALVFVAVALATVVLAVAVEWLSAVRRRRGVASQLRRLETEGLETIAPGASALFRAPSLAETGLVRALTSRVPHLRDVRNLLRQAALDWTVQSYLLAALGSGLAAGTATLVLSRNIFAAATLAAIGAALPYMYVRYRRTARLRKFEEQFPEAIDLLGRAIRAGHPLSAGLKMVFEELEDPVASEFRAIFEEQRFGMPFVDSLSAFADRVPSVDVRIFVTAILIQREVGGNLTEILDNLARIIRQRFMLQRQVRVLTAEGRFSVYVLTALPLGVAAFVIFSNPEYLRPLVEHAAGRFMLWSAVILQVVGYIWMRRITQIEF